MKKIVFVFSFLFSISFQTNAQWFWQNPWPQGNDLTSISIPESNLIYTITQNGFMLKSNNDGSTWQIIRIDTNTVYRKIHFINAQIGFIKGNGFYKSIDGGITWLDLNLGHSTNSAFYFLDSLNGWVVGDNGFYRTSDSGETWDSIASTYLYNFDFLNTSLGYGVTGNEINKTTDGGYTWQNKYMNSTSYFLRDIIVLSDSITIAIGQNGKILRSNDYGENWDFIYCPTNENLVDIESISQNTAWIVGQSGVILRTTDSGVTWQPQTAYTNSFFLSISFNTSGIGYVVGQFGKIFKTTNLGNNWINLSKGYYDKIKEVFFLTQEIGWAGSENGKIFKTTLGGNDWQLQSSLAEGDIDKIQFHDENIGWLSASGRLYKTIDGGQHWNLHYVPLRDFTFIDALNGWLINGDKLYKTSDGGNNWIDIANDFYNYYKLFFISNNYGWALTGTGTIKNTTNGGLTWNNETNLSISGQVSMFFTDQNKGWVVGAEGKIIYTIDGGINWYNQSSTILNALSNIEFTNDSNGYILALPLDNEQSTYILTTKNGGISWDKQELSIVGRLNFYDSHFINNSVGWIVGENGTVLKTTNGGVTFIEYEENNLTQPEQFLLQQNYPNPFNPSTSIQYAISSMQYVTLKVYDLLGREVAALVKEEKVAGKYEVNFNASNLTSGVYFYRLQAGSFVQTRKMMLLK